MRLYPLADARATLVGQNQVDENAYASLHILFLCKPF